MAHYLDPETARLVVKPSDTSAVMMDDDRMVRVVLQNVPAGPYTEEFVDSLLEALNRAYAAGMCAGAEELRDEFKRLMRIVR